MLKKLINKVLPVVLSFCILISFSMNTNFKVFAKNSIFNYEITGRSTITVTGCNTPQSKLVIPEKIDGYTVTALKNLAFWGASWLVDVTIPGTISILTNENFKNCQNLKNITIKEGVRKIERYAFFNCSNIEKVALPDSLLYIGKNFDDTALYNNESNWTNNVLYINNHIIKARENAKNVTIRNNTKCLAEEAFSACNNISTITIPDSVISLGNYCFSGCNNLKNIKFSSNIYEINYGTFSSCSSLTNISLPNCIRYIDEDAFANCSNLKSINMGNSLSSIYDDAFKNCTKLTNITMPDSVNYIASGAFSNTGYVNDESNWKNGILYIGNHLICSKNTVTDCVVKDGTICIANDAFYNMSNLCSIKLPDSIESIGEWAFAGTSISNITIPSNLGSIEYGAFYGSNLKSIELPKSIVYVSKFAFWNCDNMKTIIIHNPNCYIAYDDTALDDGTTIFGHDNSTAQVWAKTYHRDFNSICKYTLTSSKKATSNKNGLKNYECKSCGTKKSAMIYYPKTIKLSSTNYTYNGKVRKPIVTVKDSKGNNISASNYTVSYASGRKNVGNYTVTIKFKGNYSGTVKKTFKIKPKATTLSGVTAKSKGFTIKWKKQAVQTTGYEIQYATNSKFTKNKKTVTVSKNSRTSKTISKLSAKKKYYVRIRTYKTVKINGKNTKIYSSWSKSKAVTTKK